MILNVFTNNYSLIRSERNTKAEIFDYSEGPEILWFCEIYWLNTKSCGVTKNEGTLK